MKGMQTYVKNNLYLTIISYMRYFVFVFVLRDIINLFLFNFSADHVV